MIIKASYKTERWGYEPYQLDEHEKSEIIENLSKGSIVIADNRYNFSSRVVSTFDHLAAPEKVEDWVEVIYVKISKAPTVQVPT